MCITCKDNCVGCIKDENCQHIPPLLCSDKKCDPSTKKCVYAYIETDSDCKDNIDGSLCIKVNKCGECRENKDCNKDLTRTICDKDINKCVPCLSDDDCSKIPENQRNGKIYCDNQKAISKKPKAVPNPKYHTCVECTVDKQCVNNIHGKICSFEDPMDYDLRTCICKKDKDCENNKKLLPLNNPNNKLLFCYVPKNLETDARECKECKTGSDCANSYPDNPSKWGCENGECTGKCQEPPKACFSLIGSNGITDDSSNAYIVPEEIVKFLGYASQDETCTVQFDKYKFTFNNLKPLNKDFTFKSPGKTNVICCHDSPQSSCCSLKEASYFLQNPPDSSTCSNGDPISGCMVLKPIEYFEGKFPEFVKKYKKDATPQQQTSLIMFLNNLAKKQPINWYDMKNIIDMGLGIEKSYSDIYVSYDTGTESPGPKKVTIIAIIIYLPNDKYLVFEQKDFTKSKQPDANDPKGIIKTEIRYFSCPAITPAPIPQEVEKDTRWYLVGIFDKSIPETSSVQNTGREVQQTESDAAVLGFANKLTPMGSGFLEISDGNYKKGSFLVIRDLVLLATFVKQGASLVQGVSLYEKAVWGSKNAVPILSNGLFDTYCVVDGTNAAIQVYKGDDLNFEKAVRIVSGGAMGLKVMTVVVPKIGSPCLSYCNKFLENNLIKNLLKFPEKNSLSSQIEYLLNNLKLFSNDPSKNKEAIQIILEKFYQLDKSKKARMIFGGNRVSGTAKLGSDLDIGFVGLSEPEIRTFKNYVNKNLNKLYGTSNIQYIEHTWIYPGYVGEGIPKIESPEEFFMRCGQRITGEEFTSSGYIAVSQEGVTHQQIP